MIVFSLHYFQLLEYELMPFTENRLESMDICFHRFFWKAHTLGKMVLDLCSHESIAILRAGGITSDTYDFWLRLQSRRFSARVRTQHGYSMHDFSLLKMMIWEQCVYWSNLLFRGHTCIRLNIKRMFIGDNRAVCVRIIEFWPVLVVVTLFSGLRTAFVFEIASIWRMVCTLTMQSFFARFLLPFLLPLPLPLLFFSDLFSIESGLLSSFERFDDWNCSFFSVACAIASASEVCSVVSAIILISLSWIFCLNLRIAKLSFMIRLALWTALNRQWVIRRRPLTVIKSASASSFFRFWVFPCKT